MADKKNDDQEWLEKLDEVIDEDYLEEEVEEEVVEEAPVNEGKAWTREGSGPLVRVVE